MMCRLSKWTQRAWVGLVKRAWEKVSAARRLLNSSWIRGSAMPQSKLRAAEANTAVQPTRKIDQRLRAARPHLARTRVPRRADWRGEAVAGFRAWEHRVH